MTKTTESVPLLLAAVALVVVTYFATQPAKVAPAVTPTVAPQPQPYAELLSQDLTCEDRHDSDNPCTKEENLQEAIDKSNVTHMEWLRNDYDPLSYGLVCYPDGDGGQACGSVDVNRRTDTADVPGRPY